VTDRQTAPRAAPILPARLPLWRAVPNWSQRDGCLTLALPAACVAAVSALSWSCSVATRVRRPPNPSSSRTSRHRLRARVHDVSDDRSPPRVGLGSRCAAGAGARRGAAAAAGRSAAGGQRWGRQADSVSAPCLLATTPPPRRKPPPPPRPAQTTKQQNIKTCKQRAATSRGNQGLA
jgi:hypothetical protein